MTEPKEAGQAGVLITLEDGIITIFHTESPNSVLLQWEGSGNDWNKMWELFRTLAENAKE